MKKQIFAILFAVLVQQHALGQTPRIRNSTTVVDVFETTRLSGGLTTGVDQRGIFTDVVRVNDGTQRFLAATLGGDVFALNSRGELLSQTPVLTRQQSGNTADFNQRRGLNSFELHPDFANQGTFGFGKAYSVVSQNATGNGELGTFGNDHDSVLVEYDLSTTNFIGNPTGLNGASASPAREVLRLGQTGPSHNGFDIAFRPDGQLFVSVGDGTAAPLGNDDGQRLQLAQNLDSAFGTVLRINPDAGAAQSSVSANGQYSIPNDNPFVGQSSSVTGNAALPEIYANGFRSPFRIAVDPNDPNQVILGDVGAGSREEINIVVAGGNYGWGLREGSLAAGNGGLITVQVDGSTTLTGPEFEYGRVNLANTGIGEEGGGISVIAGFRYEGLGDQDGLFADFEFLTDQLLGAELGNFGGFSGSNARVFFGDPDGDLTNASQEVDTFLIDDSDFSPDALNGLGLPSLITGLVEGFNGEIFIFGLDGTANPGVDEGDNLAGFLTVAAILPDGTFLPPVSTAVPEPSSCLLLCAAGGLIGLRRRR